MADGPMLDVEQAVVASELAASRSRPATCAWSRVLSEARDRVEAASCFEPDSQRLPMLAGAIAATMRMRRPDEGPVMRTVFEGNAAVRPARAPGDVPRVAPPRVPPAVRRRVHLRDRSSRRCSTTAVAIGGDRDHARAPRAALHDRGRRRRLPARPRSATRRHRRRATATSSARAALARVVAEVQSEVDRAGARRRRPCRRRRRRRPLRDPRRRRTACLAMTPAYAAFADARALPARPPASRSGELDFSQRRRATTRPAPTSSTTRRSGSRREPARPS